MKYHAVVTMTVNSSHVERNRMRFRYATIEDRNLEQPSSTKPGGALQSLRLSVSTNQQSKRSSNLQSKRSAETANEPDVQPWRCMPQLCNSADDSQSKERLTFSFEFEVSNPEWRHEQR